MEKQKELRKHGKTDFMKIKALMPDVGAAFDAYFAECYKDGLLEGKTKHLMAITGALVQGCRACILAQVDKAIEKGAKPGEILEACVVAMSLGGTMAAGESTRVVAYLSELGLIE